MKRTPLFLAFLATLVAVPAAAQDGPRVGHQNELGRPFTPAIQVGNMYWLSGKLGANRETRAMTEGRVNEAYSSYFQTFAAPSRVAMEVAALVGGGTIEISFIAVKN